MYTLENGVDALGVSHNDDGNDLITEDIPTGVWQAGWLVSWICRLIRASRTGHYEVGLA